jgi:N-acetylneuraminate synthase/N,N'-diacetyllegionaminate synthase
MNVKHVVIIAEAGVNHNGDINKALELIDVAAYAGADYVKFQTFKAEKIVNPSAQKATYQKKNMKGDEDTQFGMLKKLEMGDDWYPVLIDRCQKKGIHFLSTGFDADSIDFLNSLEIPFYKIPSGEITNKPYLQHVARKRKDIILSTGMSNIQEVAAALDVLISEGISKERITVLHCNTEYPTPMEDVNLLAMNQMAHVLGVKVGYSDHTLGIEVPVAAVALGACVIEKHFTLNRQLPGPDHAASLEPAELKAMVHSIRNIEKAIGGSGVKEPSPSERQNILIARKSLHLKRNITKGTVLCSDDLVALRPGDGISPMKIEEVLGREVQISLNEGTKLLNEHFR